MSVSLDEIADPLLGSTAISFAVNFETDIVFLCDVGSILSDSLRIGQGETILEIPTTNGELNVVISVRTNLSDRVQELLGRDIGLFKFNGI